MGWVEAAIRWYGMLVLVTWAFAPAVRWLCTALPDRGATIARPLALLGMVYPAWLLTSAGLAQFGTIPLLLTLLVAGSLGWSLAWRRKTITRDWLCALLASEAAGLGCFLAYLWLRGFTPQILGTEKPMDVAFLASSARTIAMPPPDPWFAGEPINYYYLGYLLHGSVGRLAGVAPQFAFNLALAAVFSMTAAASFGAVWNVLRPALALRLAAAGGLLAAFLVVLSGNLYAPFRLIQAPRATWEARWWDSAVGIGWRSSRIVCDGPRSGNLCEFPAVETINEFPYFSVLLGDLHPHLMALPYTVAAMALAWNLATVTRSSAHGSRTGWLARLAVTGTVIGALYPLNAWDFPTYLVLAGIAVWAGVGGSAARARTSLPSLAAAAILAWLPFWVNFDPPTRGTGVELLDRVPIVSSIVSAVGLHTGERTSLGEYLTIFGVPYLFGLVFVIAGLDASGLARDVRSRQLVLVAGAALLIPAVTLNAPVIALCGLPLVLALSALVRERSVSPRAAAVVLFSFAWVLSIGVEIVYIRDAFDSRMNTLFKFYYQTWTLFAIATAVALPLLWAETARRRRQRLALAGTAAVMVASGLAYPMVASWQWTSGFAGWRGLNGIAYGEESNPDEVAAIRWLQQVAEPDDVVLEAAGCSYRPFDRLPFNRFSAFTGVPSVIGWEGHQRQWRAGQPDRIAEIRTREEDVATMYGEPNSPLINAYGVAWLVVGEYEAGEWQDECPTAGPYPGIDAPGFPGAGWEEAFRSGDTRVYRRVAD